MSILKAIIFVVLVTLISKADLYARQEDICKILGNFLENTEVQRYIQVNKFVVHPLIAYDRENVFKNCPVVKIKGRDLLISPDTSRKQYQVDFIIYVFEKIGKRKFSVQLLQRSDNAFVKVEFKIRKEKIRMCKFNPSYF